MVGGTTSGATLVGCQTGKSRRYCLEGWIPFDQYCYYKPNVFTQANLQSSYSDAEAICTSLGVPGATQAWTPTDYVQTWLQQVSRPLTGARGLVAAQLTPMGSVTSCGSATRPM